jgi:hypothetical protein
MNTLKYVTMQTLGAFTKLGKTSIRFVMSVRPPVRPSVSLPLRLSVRMEEFGSLWTDFPET